MKKIIAFLCCFAGGNLLLFTLSLAGCDKKDFYFRYTDMSSEVHRYDTSMNDVLGAGDTCKFINHGLQLDMKYQVMYSASSLNFGNRLYAWQPDESSYKNIEEIEDIRVIPLYDYNSDYPAGKDISGACGYTISENLAYAVNTEKELIEQLKGYLGDRYSAAPFKIGLQFQAPPAQASRQQFVIEMETVQHTLIRDTTIAFVLSL